ncbi:MAG TPA: NfeD family protein, partial [Planctomycetota bacterium]|nr:NfeD family protein [Planctomycetota bacterium]
LAVLSLIGGVALAFRESAETGWIFVAIAVGGGLGSAFFAFSLFPRTPWGRRMILAGPTFAKDPAATDPRVRDLLDKSGVAVSYLRPSGIAEIEGRRVDVVADGELLPAGTRLRVTRLDGNRVVVARATDSTSTPEKA